MSASATLPLTDDSELRQGDCPDPPATTPLTSMTVVPGPGGTFAIEADAPAAPNVGIAVLRNRFPGVTRYSQLALDVYPLDGTSVVYDAGGDKGVVAEHQVVIVLASVCRAGGVPGEAPMALKVNLEVGTTSPLAVPQDVREQLIRTACRYAGGEPIPIITRAGP